MRWFASGWDPVGAIQDWPSFLDSRALGVPGDGKGLFDLLAALAISSKKHSPIDGSLYFRSVAGLTLLTSFGQTSCKPWAPDLDSASLVRQSPRVQGPAFNAFTPQGSLSWLRGKFIIEIAGLLKHCGHFKHNQLCLPEGLPPYALGLTGS